MQSSPRNAPKAVLFDVFGTCVDWRTPVAIEVAGALEGVDAYAFADAWREEYDPAMAEIRDGNRGYVALDVLHRENLHRVADRFGARAPDGLARVWERLTPWPDTVPGLLAIRAHAIIAPCSNGSIALMTHLSRHASLHWDCILGAEIARGYKPDRSVYLASCSALQLDPSDVMMVAAHNGDLHAARLAGLQTGFLPRPMEWGPGQTTNLAPEDDWDIIAEDILDLARKLFP